MTLLGDAYDLDGGTDGGIALISQRSYSGKPIYEFNPQKHIEWRCLKWNIRRNKHLLILNDCK